MYTCSLFHFLTPAIPYAPISPLKDPPSWETDIFVSKDESSHAPDKAVDKAEKLCFMSKPSINHPKVIFNIGL